MKGIEIKQIPNGPWKENCFIVINKKKDALLIDPGSSFAKIDNIISSEDLKPCAIVNTHAHYDHIGAVHPLKKKYGIPFFLSSKDERLLKSANFFSKLFDGMDQIILPSIDYYIDKIEIGDYLNHFHIDIITTPGHTRGSVCILIEDCLFTGDTLLKNRIGRTDLPGGNQDELHKSLKLILSLPPDTKIYPGHGKSSTIANEVKLNNELVEIIR